MINRRIVSLDKKTGEILEGVIIYCPVKNNPYSKGWTMNSQEASRIFAADKDLKGQTHRVLWYLLSILDFENWIQIDYKDAVKVLDMKRQNISRAVSILESKEIIIRGNKIGCTYNFRLNPDFIWKGKVKNLEEYRKEKEQERVKDLKNKINTKKNYKLEALSKKYNIPIEEIRECLQEDSHK